MRIDFGLEAAKLASLFKAKLNALDRSPNLDDARANVVQIDNQAVTQLHISELLRKANGGWLTCLSIRLFFLHLVSFHYFVQILHNGITTVVNGVQFYGAYCYGHGR